MPKPSAQPIFVNSIPFKLRSISKPLQFNSLAVVHVDYEYDFAGAEKAFKRAIELDPNYGSAHQWYAELLTASSRHDEAIRESSRALELDPFSLTFNAVMLENRPARSRFSTIPTLNGNENGSSSSALEFSLIASSCRLLAVNSSAYH